MMTQIPLWVTPGGTPQRYLGLPLSILLSDRELHRVTLKSEGVLMEDQIEDAKRTLTQAIEDDIEDLLSTREYAEGMDLLDEAYKVFEMGALPNLYNFIRVEVRPEGITMNCMSDDSVIASSYIGYARFLTHYFNTTYDKSFSTVFWLNVGDNILWQKPYLPIINAGSKPVRELGMLAPHAFYWAPLVAGQTGRRTQTFDFFEALDETIQACETEPTMPNYYFHGMPNNTLRLFMRDHGREYNIPVIPPGYKELTDMCKYDLVLNMPAVKNWSVRLLLLLAIGRLVVSVNMIFLYSRPRSLVTHFTPFSFSSDMIGFSDRAFKPGRDYIMIDAVECHTGMEQVDKALTTYEARFTMEMLRSFRELEYKPHRDFYRKLGRRSQAKAVFLLSKEGMCWYLDELLKRYTRAFSGQVKRELGRTRTFKALGRKYEIGFEGSESSPEYLPGPSPHGRQVRRER